MDRKKASGYIRVVTDDRNAIDEQKRNIENAVFEHEYDLADVFIDTGSGAGLEREGIRKLLDDIKNNGVTAVFVNSKDTLSTDNTGITELLETLSTMNIRVYSISDKRFLNTPADTLGNLSRKIYNTLYEMEQNGINLLDDITSNEKSIVKDPTIELQNKIIEAYLDIHADNRPQV
ncbi:MAG: recombinase family protein [Bacillota bacterium]